MSTAARAYLSAALDTLQRVSMHRDERNWSALRDSAFERAGAAQTPADTYDAIRWALRTVDRHSFLQVTTPLAAGRAPNPAPARNRVPAVEGRLIAGDIGYIRVPTHGGGPSDRFYADSLHIWVRTLDSMGACGWVIDLRGNGGGNMWPMLAGIGPLLADSIVGQFVIHGDTSVWIYRDGGVGSGRRGAKIETFLRTTIPAHRVRQANAPVAVLTDSITASSGEAIATAFRGRPRTRSFGAPTFGVSTVNNGYRLSDGANMVITIGIYLDRLGAPTGSRMPPDEVIAALPNGDRVLDRAMAWLRTQCGS